MNKKRILFLIGLLAVSVGIALYCQYYLGISIVYSHFFYIPIMITAIWWGYWGLAVAGGLGLLIILLNIPSGAGSFFEDIYRSIFFIIVAFLTAYISNSQKKIEKNLILSNKMIQLRESIIGLMTHQVRKPLTTIRWTLESILKKIKNKEQKEELETCYDSVLKLNNSVEDFLELNKVEISELKKFKQTVNIGEVVKKIIEENKDEISHKKIILKINIKKTPPIFVDRVIIREVVNNYLSNAIKYTPSNGEISIFLKQENNKIIFSIADTGCGIPQEDQNNIFKKFFRAGNAEKMAPGTGLGLYISRDLVRLSGGRTWFTSEENKGSTFYFSFPL